MVAMHKEQDRPVQLFNIGDVVRVVDTPYEECPFDWVDAMDEYCGKEAKVRCVSYDSARDAWSYSLDNNPWVWCENCFVHDTAELEESESSIGMLLS